MSQQPSARDLLAREFLEQRKTLAAKTELDVCEVVSATALSVVVSFKGANVRTPYLAAAWPISAGQFVLVAYAANQRIILGRLAGTA